MSRCRVSGVGLDFRGYAGDDGCENDISRQRSLSESQIDRIFAQFPELLFAASDPIRGVESDDLS